MADREREIAREIVQEIVFAGGPMRQDRIEGILAAALRRYGAERFAAGAEACAEACEREYQGQRVFREAGEEESRGSTTASVLREGCLAIAASARKGAGGA